MPQGPLPLVEAPAILALYFGECGLAGNSTLKQPGEQERYSLSRPARAWTGRNRYLKCFITCDDVGEPTFLDVYEAR
jgi:hypothetical protein